MDLPSSSQCSGRARISETVRLTGVPVGRRLVGAGVEREPEQRRTRVPGVLGHERRQRGAPAAFGLADPRSALPMPLQLTDDPVAREAERLVAGAEMPLILPGIGQARSDQVAGARPHPQVRGGLGRRQEGAEAGELSRGQGSAVMPSGSMDRTSLRVSGLAILRS